MDLELQRIAEKSLVRGLNRLEKDFPYLKKIGRGDRLEGAIVVIKPQTGEIKAMVGGRDYQKSQFNITEDNKLIDEHNKKRIQEYYQDFGWRHTRPWV